MNFALYEQMHNAFEGPKDEAIRFLATETLAPAIQGALKLQQKFPSEPEILSFIYQLEEYEKLRRSESEQEFLKTESSLNPHPQAVYKLTQMLREQLLLGGEPELATMINRDPFVGGYLTHFCAIGIHKLANIELSAEETAPYTRAVMANLLGDKDALEPLISEIWQYKNLPTYQQGRAAANEDIFDWIENDGRKRPMGLLYHLIELAKSNQ